MRIHQIAPTLLYGDAVGNQIQALRRVFRSWSFESEIYTQYADPRWRYRGHPIDAYRSQKDTLVIFHYAVGAELTRWVCNLPDRVVMYYHNITPAQFVRGSDPRLSQLFQQGREQLVWFKERPLTFAASEYNRHELQKLGFQNIHIVPYLIDFDGLQASAETVIGRQVTQRYRDGSVNWLFVGRLTQNKRQDDLIRAFNYYRRLINPESRLLLVGSSAGYGTFKNHLEVEIEALCVEGVEFVGHVGLAQGLGGYYRAADVFVCMSEHEGFGIPLIESMSFDVPVVAYESSGVPFALNGAGIMFREKRFDVVAELVHLLISDDQLRARVIERQRESVVELQHTRIVGDLRRLFEQQIFSL